jgi:PIN domain nuclease of toxin-antitoxin system
MRLLLGTHAVLWYHLGDTQLSRTARALIDDPGNEKLVSAATHWEIAIKVSTGKYVLHEPFPDFVQHAIHDNKFVIVPILPAHTAIVAGLPFYHRDPFDRLLVAQAMVEGAPIVTCDPHLVPYPVARLW